MSILGGTFDESCTVTIVNNLSCDLTLKDKECSWYSGWEINPPQTIGKAQQGTYKIYDATQGFGSSGSVTYTLDLLDPPSRNYPVVSTECDCPYLSSWFGAGNTASANISGPNLFHITQEGPSDDGPLVVTFTIDYLPAIRSTGLGKILLNNKCHPIINTQGSTIWDSGSVKIYDSSKYLNDDTCAGVTGSLAPVCVNCDDDMALDVYLDNFPAVLDDASPVLIAHGSDLYESKEVKGRLTADSGRVAFTIPRKASGTPWGYAVAANWSLRLQASDQEIFLGSSRLEVYGLAKELPPYLKSGIPVNFLRRVVLPAPKTKYCDDLPSRMEKIGLQFDSYGFAHFTSGFTGGNFNLSYFSEILGPGKAVLGNACDFNAALQVARSLHPVKMPNNPWAAISPLGYVRTVRLLGCGSSNNPLYDGREDLKNLGVNDEQRQGVMNHAVLRLNHADKVSDLTFGLYQDLKPGDYLDQILDHETLLYHIKKGKDDPKRHATENDFTYGPGVAGVNTHQSLSMPRAVRTEAVEAFLATAQVGDASAAKQVRSDFARLPIDLASSGVSITDWSHSIGGDSCTTQFAGNIGDKTFTGRIVVSPDDVEAVEELRKQLYSSQLPVHQLFEPAAEGRARGQIHLVGITSAPRHLWIRGNVLVDLEASSIELLNSVAQTLDEQLASGMTSPSAEQEQQTDKASVELFPSEIVHVGDKVDVRVQAKNWDAASLTMQSKRMLFLQQKRGHLWFTLMAREVGKEVIRVSYSNRLTHQVTHVEAEMEIVA